MSDRLPLPRPGPLGLIQYAGVDMHAYADAEKAALRAELERLKTVPMKYRRMAFNAQLQAENTALRAALKELVGAADDDSADRWERAMNAAREQLKC